ncbi:hypothetical protein AURDEDRAFT_124897 [Auricularia subglabra TFB-10046 SS5]|nr:hypothetical protein AURDEDRAFT_124897 [Auricularia subglabra TFB-10046 SS5]
MVFHNALSDPSNMPVLVVVCCTAGIIVGTLVFLAKRVLRRCIRACLAWITGSVRACVAWATIRRHEREDLLPMTHIPVVPAPTYIVGSDDVANSVDLVPPPPVTPTSINCSISCSIDDPPGYASVREESAIDNPSTTQPSGVRGDASDTSMLHGSSRGDHAHAAATASDVGVWDTPAVPWSLIVASATPCASSVFETDSESDGVEGDNAKDVPDCPGVAV